jgi:hypothetical protein
LTSGIARIISREAPTPCSIAALEDAWFATPGIRHVFSLEQRAWHAFPKLEEMPLRPHEAAPVTSQLWYRAVLCDALIAARQIPMIREHFADALGAAGWPDGACLFLSARHPGDARPGDDDGAVPDAIFFSPAAIAAVPHLIAACGAEPSPPPDRACATLLVGKQSDWNLLPLAVH